jgi:hypothetical protein
MLQPTLSPAEIASYKQSLSEAERAYHSLMIGGGVREFTDQNGERVAYSGANRTGLLQYINYLRSLLGMAAFTGGYSARPAGIIL